MKQYPIFCAICHEKIGNTSIPVEKQKPTSCPRCKDKETMKEELKNDRTA